MEPASMKKTDLDKDVDKVVYQELLILPQNNQKTLIGDDKISHDTAAYNADLSPLPLKPSTVAKKKRKLITLDDIGSSQPAVLKSFPLEKLKGKGKANGKNSSNRTLRVVLSSSSQKQNNSIPLETFEFDQEEERLPNTIPM